MEDGRERQKNKNKIPLHRNELERCLVSVVSVFFSTTFRFKPYTDKLLPLDGAKSRVYI